MNLTKNFCASRSFIHESSTTNNNNNNNEQLIYNVFYSYARPLIISYKRAVQIATINPANAHAHH